MRRLNYQLVLSRLVVAGDGLFILWILYNGMDSGWQATPIQLASYIGLTILLALSGWFVYAYGRQLTH